MGDLIEVKQFFPFVREILQPYTKPQEIELEVIAVSRNVINLTDAVEDDFIGDYSKLIKVIVPFDYKQTGCKIYGAQWLDRKILKSEDYHFFSHNKEGIMEFCLGVPESFPHFKNVILENVKTAENMLTAYERFQKGESEILELKAYSHGTKGRKEYEKDKNKYQNKK